MLRRWYHPAVGTASDSSKAPKKPRSKQWWLWYGTLAWGIPFFVFVAIFWAIVLFAVTSLLERRLNWRFYADPRIHAAGLLVFSFVLSVFGGCYWGFSMWKRIQQIQATNERKS